MTQVRPVRTAKLGREYRFGVVSAGRIRSKTFKIWRQKNEAYISLRELPVVKHSLHSSGIHRWAHEAKGPRTAGLKTQRQVIRGKDGLLVFRALLTSETDWSADRGPVPKNFVALSPPPPGHGVAITVTLANHDGSGGGFHADDTFAIEVAASLYLLIFVRIVSHEDAFGALRNSHAPHTRDDGVLIQHDDPDGRFFDGMSHFKTFLNTYYYQIHHNIPRSIGPTWTSDTIIGAAFHRAFLRQRFEFGGIRSRILSSDFAATAGGRNIVQPSPW